MSKEQKALRKHNANEVGVYLETHAALIGPGPPPQEPMGKKYKGVSRVPATEAFHRFITANQHVSSLIDWRVGEILASNAAFNRVRLASVIAAVYGEPALVSKWENRATSEDEKHIAAFRAMCRLVADSIAAAAPNERLDVVINPRPPKTEEDDNTPLMKPGAPHHRNRRYTAEYNYRRRYALLAEIEEQEKCGRTEAARILAKREGVGVSTIWLGVDFIEKKNAS